MDRVTAASVFNRICELGSLSAAARALDISRPMVSRYLDEMEKWAGARLLHRSSRRLTITPAGEKVLEKTRMLARLADEITGQGEPGEPQGTLRVACAHSTATHILGPMIPAFLARYPLLRIELEINNQPVSLVGERIDVAVRITDNPEPGAIARRLGECVSVVCAAPDYLRKHGIPETPQDLSQHNCLHYSRFAGQSWQFNDANGDALTTAVSGNFSAGISSVLCDAAIAGCGLAMVPEMEARAGIANGQLQCVLPDLTPKTLSIYGLYMSRERQPAALRLFLDAVQLQLAS
ncbi:MULTISPECIES: LysR family transcriptional regulator [unclassified Pantoea]|uniref:LysR family transcriptional regulator n=1 Tax=unclassified Pantoea TaxID=2630326 RepID=UPI001CD6B158|nr:MULTISPECIES: LysR family transcriptional regulator [unclassified Pantoea]MCA1177797.1 LysR family transcriptional regulator [Pantoea sp. alder69]MCA1252924.1 LysR family transcriptional regulator [Pantoea sp. alder70]MCA1266439.1 LysR family transcriptional regulator [Pantoea sp. alder81]